MEAQEEAERPTRKREREGDNAALHPFGYNVAFVT